MYQREMFFWFHETLEDGTETTHEVSLDGEGTEYLGTIMERFQSFLHASGFDYVSLVKVEDGVYGYGSVN